MDKKITEQEKLLQRTIKQPPRVIYPLLANIWKLLYFKKLGVNVKYEIDPRKIKGPFVIISNHASRLDYIYTGIAMLPHRINFVAGYNEFFRSHLAFIFRLMQIIPKKNFVPDMYSMRSIRNILKGGGKVGLYVEGMSSISGANQPVTAGTGKFIKKLAVPVYMSHISGGYLTSTKYCLDERPGRVDVVISQLFTADQLEELTGEQIQDQINEVIFNDDYAWNKEHQVTFKANGNIAHNLHTLLYQCPKCRKEFTMKGEGEQIVCQACGNGARLDEKYNLTKLDEDAVIPATPRDWFDWERANVRKEVQEPGFKLTEKVKLGNIPADSFLQDQKTSEIVGEGTITLDINGFTYDGTRNGEPFSFHIEPQSLPTYGMCTDVTRFYTFYKNEFMEFFPEHETVEKWFMATEEIHRLNGGTWQNFKDYQTREQVAWL